MSVSQERLYQLTNVGVPAGGDQNDRLYQLVNVGIDGSDQRFDRLYQYTNMVAGAPCPWVNGTDLAIATANQPLTIFGRGFQPGILDTGPEARAYHANDPNGVYTVMGALTAWTDEQVTVSVPSGLPNPSFIRVVHTGPDATTLCTGSNLVFQQIAPFAPIPADPEAGWWVEAWNLENTAPLIRGIPVIEGPWQAVLNDIGDGSITVPAPDPDNPDAFNRHREICDPPNDVSTLLKVYIDGRYAYSFWADQISDPYGEPSEKVVTISGRGLEAIADWARLYPKDYNPAAPLAPTKFPDWNYGFALSYFETFEESNTVGPDWAARNDGYLLDTLTPGVFEVVPAGGLRSGIQRTYEVEPGSEIVWSIEVQAITTPGQRITAGVAFGEEAFSVLSPNTFEIDGEYLSEIGNVPYAGGCPGGATSAAWQPIVVQLIVPADVTSITTFVQSDHAASCGAPGNIPFYYRNAGFLGRGWNVPNGWFSTGCTVFEVRAGLGKDLTNGLYIQGDTTGQFVFTNVEVAVTPEEPILLIAECATLATWYVEAADIDTGLPLSTTTPLAGTGVYELRRFEYTPDPGTTSVLLRVVMDINQGAIEAQIDNVGTATGQDPATPGFIIREMVEAAQLRGSIPQLEIDFTDSNDSDGNLWIRTLSMNFGHGQTIYEVLAALVSQGFEWRIAPIFAAIGGDQGIMLSLYNGRSQGAPYGVGENQELTNPASAATIRQGQIMDAGESNQTITPNITFGEGAGDLSTGGTQVTQASDPAAISAIGRREDFFSNDQALDAQTLQDAAATRLDNLRKQSVAATIELLQASPYIPGVDFGLGDTIKVALGEQIPEDWYRAVRIGGTLAGEGDVDIRYVVDIGAVIIPEDAVMAVTLAQLVALTQLSGSPGSGTSTGVSSGVSGAPLILPDETIPFHTHPYSGIIPSGLSGDLKGSNPSPTVQGIQGRRVVTDTPTESALLSWNGDSDIWELGSRMNWRDTWVDGLEYVTDDAVRDGAWTMVANTTTTDQPAPQPVGPAAWLLPTEPAWTINPISDTVISGIRVAGLTTTYYAEAIRVWIQDLSAQTVYQLVIKDNSTGALSIEAPFVGSDITAIGWFPIGRPVFMGPADDFSFLLIQHSNVPLTPTTAPWTWTGFSNSAADPGTGNINGKGNSRVLRINDIDDGSVDQSGLLATVRPGTVIRIEQQGDATKFVEYLVSIPDDQGGFWAFGVTEIDRGSSGPPDDDALSDVTFSNPTLDPMQVVQIPNGWLGDAVISGQYAEGNAPIATDDNAYGVDVFAQEFTGSPDWDLLAVSTASGAFGSGGGGSGGGHIIEDEGVPLAQQPTLNFAGAGVTATDDPGNTATLITIPGGSGGGPIAGAKVRLTANVPLPTSVWTPVPWQLADWDDAAYWNPGTPTRLTVPAGGDGRYLITGEADITNTVTTGDRLLHILKNGVPLDEILSSGDQAIVVSSHRIQIVGIVDLIAGDYIELEAITTAGVALAFIGSATNTLHTQLAISKLTTKRADNGELIVAGAGPAQIVTGTSRVYAPSGRTITGVRVSCGVAPSGGPLTIQVELDGVDIFTAPGRPSCADGTNVSTVVVPSTTAWGVDSYLTFDVDEVNGAEDVTVQLEWEAT